MAYRGYYPKKGSKYHNKKSNGFDSKKEENRYYELKLLERAGIIHDLKRQVHFELTPTIRQPDTIGPKGGRKPGKVEEYKSEYIADFTYYQGEDFIVEDVKGYRGGEAYALFSLKRKIMRHYKGIKIHEV